MNVLLNLVTYHCFDIGKARRNRHGSYCSGYWQRFHGNALVASCVYHHIMLLVESSPDYISEILQSARPVAVLATENRDHAKKIAIAARDHGLGVSVLQERSGRLLVMVVADAADETKLGLFVRRYDAEITRDRNVDLEKVYVPASWNTGMAARQGADVGERF
jgi:hypothetical protein